MVFMPGSNINAPGINVQFNDTATYTSPYGQGTGVLIRHTFAQDGTITLRSNLIAGTATLKAGTLNFGYPVYTPTFTVSNLQIQGGTANFVTGSFQGTPPNLALSNDGVFRIAADANKNLKLTALSITGPTAKVDVTNNKMVISGASPTGSWTGSSYDGLTGLVASGRSGSTWTGGGIVTSQTAAQGTNYTTVGIARASDARPDTATTTALWNGQTVTGSDTLIMYTYGGDATLDGLLNIDDYTRIDSGVAAGLKGWANGDFNYDGNVNIDDYVILDANITTQGPPLGSGAGLEGVAAVPEPAGGAILALAALLSRRRRRSED
jgi:hypothetical protein